MPAVHPPVSPDRLTRQSRFPRLFRPRHLGPQRVQRQGRGEGEQGVDEREACHCELSSARGGTLYVVPWPSIDAQLPLAAIRCSGCGTELGWRYVRPIRRCMLALFLPKLSLTRLGARTVRLSRLVAKV